jgi:multidrug efflux pump subunit AcrA (membrane-fusion protein)
MRSWRASAPSEVRGGWRGARLVALMAVVAVLALGGGILVSRFVVSPADLAAESRAPEAGAITAPIEKRVIENTITSRADVTYAGAVEVKVDTTGLQGPAVVTGHVPEVGATLVAGSVALEVAGRPLIVLPGDLPVYRSLHAGLSGPDVLQLKAGLASLGIDPGDASSDVFDAATAAALDTLYRNAGYPAPSASPDAEDRVIAAQEAVRSAQAGLDQAAAALDTAQAGASSSQRVEADNAVREAQRALAEAQQSGDPGAIARGQDALDLAYARRDELLATPRVSAEQSAVEAARAQLSDAQDALAKAQEAALTVLPAGEVVYLASLPRRVDAVSAERGSVLQGAAMSVSGAELELAGSASETDAALLKPGMTARFTAASGSEYGATITSVDVQKPDASGGSGTEGAQKRYRVLLKPQDLTPEAVEALKGSNVKVSIPVQSTSGEVLAAPVAALTAGAGGEARVELVVGEDAATGRAQTELVPVTAGLSAGGFVEVTSADPRVAAGANVVVGR